MGSFCVPAPLPERSLLSHPLLRSWGLQAGLAAPKGGYVGLAHNRGQPTTGSPSLLPRPQAQLGMVKRLL